MPARPEAFTDAAHVESAGFLLKREVFRENLIDFPMY